MNLFIFPNLNANHNTKSKIYRQKEMYIIINNHKH